MDEYSDKRVWKWDPNKYSWPQLKSHINRRVADGHYKVKCFANQGYKYYPCDMDDCKEPYFVDLHQDGTFYVVFV
jgi:hypothetical protein